jgi:hypothetical protein
MTTFLPSGPSLIISYFSTNLDGTAGVWKRRERLVPWTTEAAGRAGRLLWVGDPSPAARAAHGHLRRRSPELQLSIEGVRRILLLLRLVLVQRVPLDRARELLQVRRVLLLHLLLLLRLLPLEVLDLMVLLQLKRQEQKVTLPASRLIFRTQPSLSPLNSLKILPQLKVKQHLLE